jgi:hypothetical protein
MNMRPTRGPYARPDRDTPWFLPSAGIALGLLVLTVPAYMLFPDIFPGAMMWLLGAIAVLILAWTFSKEGRAQLRPHQVAANLGMAVVLVVFIFSLAVNAPVWVTWLITMAAIACGLAALYRRPD